MRTDEISIKIHDSDNGKNERKNSSWKCSVHQVEWNGMGHVHGYGCVECVRVCLFMPVLAACTFPFGHLYNIHSSSFSLSWIFVCTHTLARLMGLPQSSSVINELSNCASKERSMRCACSIFPHYFHWFSFENKQQKKYKNQPKIDQNVLILFINGMFTRQKIIYWLLDYPFPFDSNMLTNENLLFVAYSIFERSNLVCCMVKFSH